MSKILKTSMSIINTKKKIYKKQAMAKYNNSKQLKYKLLKLKVKANL